MATAGTNTNGNGRRGARVADTARSDTPVLVPSRHRSFDAGPASRSQAGSQQGRFQDVRDRLQIWVWQRLMSRIHAVSNVVQPHKLPDESDFVKPIPASRRYPALVGSPLIFSEQTPASERHPAFEAAVIRFTMWLKEWYAMGDRLPDPYTAVGAPYPALFAKLQTPPVIPADFQVDDKLARVARRGPFSFHTQRTGDNEFSLDLSALEGLDPRAPFIATGGVARFAREGQDELRTLQIDFRGHTIRPGELGFTLAERRFLSGLNTYTTVVEHLVYLHIATAGVWSIVARMAFSPRHPLRVLLQPFTEETNRVNNYNIDGLLLSEHSNVPIYTGYTLEQASVLVRQSGRAFDVRLMDPEYRARVQGQLNDPTFPTVNSAVEVFQIFLRFTRAWCHRYLPAVDLETRIFCQELDFRVPNGVRRMLEIDDWSQLTSDHVAYLLAVGAFAASVGHHIVNDLTRDYFMSFHLMPPALDEAGHPTLGVVQEKQASVFSAGVQRYLLISQAALPDEDGKRLWNHFQHELKQYEAGLEADPATEPYRIHPSRISSSIHA